MRDEIDHIDDELMNLLSNRMKVARDIGDYKKDNNMTILQAKRWNEILEKAKKVSSERGLSMEFVTKFINAVHEESINQQEDIFKRK